MKDQIKQWKKEATIAYNTKAFCQSFELYWEITASLRKGMPKKTVKEMKTVKETAWEAFEE